MKSTGTEDARTGNHWRPVPVLYRCGPALYFGGMKSKLVPMQLALRFGH